MAFVVNSSNISKSVSSGYRSDTSESPITLSGETTTSGASEHVGDHSPGREVNNNLPITFGDAELVPFGRCQRLIDLVNETNYSLSQVNGQRTFGGPPPGWTGPPPAKGCEVFVGNIPRDCFEDELVPVFRAAGTIYEMRLMMQFNGLNRGYAFITYTNHASAMNAIKYLNHFEIRPRTFIGVVDSVDNCRVFIGRINNVRAEEVIQHVCEITEDVIKVSVYHNRVYGYGHGQHQRRPRWAHPDVDYQFSAASDSARGAQAWGVAPEYATKFIIVEYLTHRAAAMAKRRLSPEASQLWGSAATVEWATTLPNKAPRQGMVISGVWTIESGLQILESTETFPPSGHPNQMTHGEAGVNGSYNPELETYFNNAMSLTGRQISPLPAQSPRTQTEANDLQGSVLSHVPSDLNYSVFHSSYFSNN